MFMFLGMGLRRGRFHQRLMHGSRKLYRNREELLQAIDQFLQLAVTGKQFFDLGTKVGAFFRSLLMGKYVVIVLHGDKTSRKS